MISKCVCYTIDQGYVLPALASAIMLRAQIVSTSADIVIVCFGSSTDKTRAAAEVCAAEGITFLTVPASVLQGMPMICARFFLDGILDPCYLDVTYLDADTQVLNPLAPLLECPIPPGGLVAITDLMALMADDPGSTWQQHRSYFRTIGIPDPRHASYFNSGVIRFKRADWRGISEACLALCRSPVGQSFKFRDQDALNVVLAGNTAPVSLKWNFPGFFLDCGLEDLVVPSIVHYMSKPRPWDGPFHPWGAKGAIPYTALVAQYPVLADLHRPMTGAKRLKYTMQQLYKRASDNWGTQAMRARIERYEAQAIA